MSPAGRWRQCLCHGDVEDRADSQEEASEYGPQLRDQVELHHLAKVGVVAGGVWLELKGENKKERKGSDENRQLETPVAAVGPASATATATIAVATVSAAAVANVAVASATAAISATAATFASATIAELLFLPLILFLLLLLMLQQLLLLLLLFSLVLRVP